MYFFIKNKRRKKFNPYLKIFFVTFSRITKFVFFRGDLILRIAHFEIFRVDLTSRILANFTKTAKCNSCKN